MQSIFLILHLAALFFLFGITCAAFAAPAPERRKKYLMWSGICSLLVFVSGFAMLGMLKIGFPLWVTVKLLCWLILSALAGVAYRMKEKIPALTVTAGVVVFVAIAMVTLKP